MHDKTIIGLLGPSTGGKSSLVQGICDMYPTMYCRVSFADYLKRVATTRGWDGSKTPEGRAFLQRVSEDLKAEFGEDVFFRVGIEIALHREQPVVIFDDTRFLIEITNMLAGRIDATSEIENCYDGHILVLEEHEAEAKWETSVLSNLPEDAWAKHRSELDWRVFRHLFPAFNNNKSLGLEIGIQLFSEFISQNI